MSIKDKLEPSDPNVGELTEGQAAAVTGSMQGNTDKDAARDAPEGTPREPGEGTPSSGFPASRTPSQLERP